MRAWASTYRYRCVDIVSQKWDQNIHLFDQKCNDYRRGSYILLIFLPLSQWWCASFFLHWMIWCDHWMASYHHSFRVVHRNNILWNMFNSLYSCCTHLHFRCNFVNSKTCDVLTVLTSTFALPPIVIFMTMRSVPRKSKHFIILIWSNPPIFTTVNVTWSIIATFWGRVWPSERALVQFHEFCGFRFKRFVFLFFIIFSIVFFIVFFIIGLLSKSDEWS